MQIGQAQYVMAPQGQVQYVQAPPQYVTAPQVAAPQVVYTQAAPVTYKAHAGAPIQYAAPQPTVTYARAAPAAQMPPPVVRPGSSATGERSWRVKLGAEMPNFQCDTTHGDFSFHEFLDSDPEMPFTVLFSHPKDFTPVCTTELGRCEQLAATAFRERGVKLIGISCDSVEEHLAWSGDVLHRVEIQKPDGQFLSFPIIADSKRQIVEQLGMIDPDERDAAGIPLPARALIVIGPDKKVKLSILYPATTGRNFEEVIRVIDSLQLTAGQGLATPADWTMGKRCIVAPNVSTEDARARFQNLHIEDLPSGKQYLRTVDCPM